MMEDRRLLICNQAFSLLIQEKIEDAKKSKRKLLSCSLSKMEQEFTLTEMTIFAVDFFRQLKFFPDQQTVAYFREFGLYKRHLRWFVSMQKIIDEFNEIEKAGIKIDKLSALWMIEQHLDIKIALEIFNYVFGLAEDDSVIMNKISKKFRQILERQKRAGGNLKYFKFPYDAQWNELAQNSKIRLVESWKLMVKCLDGKTEYFEIQHLLEKCFFLPESMSKRKFHIIVYELLRSIMKDQTRLIDHSRFMELKDITDTWDTFRAKQIKTIVYKK